MTHFCLEEQLCSAIHLMKRPPVSPEKPNLLDEIPKHLFPLLKAEELAQRMVSLTEGQFLARSSWSWVAPGKLTPLKFK